jgi:hypothetical protein
MRHGRSGSISASDGKLQQGDYQMRSPFQFVNLKLVTLLAIATLTAMVGCATVSVHPAKKGEDGIRFYRPSLYL